MIWPVCRLQDICEFQNGFAFKSKLFSNDGTPILRISNIQSGSIDLKQMVYTNLSSYKENLDKYRVVDGDLLIAMSGATTGKIGINQTGLEFLLNQRVGKFLPSKHLDKKYLYYYLNTKIQEHLDISAGSAQPNLSTEQIKSIKIPLPDIPEQKRIVTILEQAFADIEQARDKTEQNLKNARELFESYLQQIFSQRGDGWIECPLGSICNFKHGFAFKSEYFTENSDLVLLTPGNFFEEGGYRDRGNKQKYYDGPFPKDFLLTKNSLLVAMTEQAVGLLGSPALVPDDDIFLHNQRLGLVELTSEFEGKVSMEFLFHLFNTKHFRSKVQETASGAKVRHTSPKKMQVITVSLPNDINEQSIIAQKLFCLKEKSLELEGFYSQKLLYLDELKKSILQKAFTGKLSKSNT
ncbi:restriction endonuclease subunit S [Shewanella sp. SW36]|uniref:restriction endonuclease subunit S n=1 Tax=unclassified Shewanella TaxID=196818 RepID=UPI0021DA8AFE|nr:MULTISPECIES: restriction endonuclease subunit S [unclassified Shewanella]MCU7976531.1 restriction endonuclease subunit S [Shewanella sp. SW36]MCU7991771.1 restriction endonuclease subunit S [Shewanella sp. SW1]MCU8053151.1 restriction endonuclease subunit S [Shewanella sp. SM43]